jgi:ABC-type arginine/histidine transport system permease subunit
VAGDQRDISHGREEATRSHGLDRWWLYGTLALPATAADTATGLVQGGGA